MRLFRELSIMDASSSNNKSGGVRKKRMITMDIKHDIINKYERGARVVDLAAEYKRSPSTISTILRQKEAIKKVKPSKGISILSPLRNSINEKMEMLLMFWIKEKQLTEDDNISENIICQKASEIYEDLKQEKIAQLLEEETDPSASITKMLPFKASHGWFSKFKKRTGLHKVRNKFRINHIFYLIFLYTLFDNG